MKKITAFVMAVLMLCTLFGCGKKRSSSNELWVVTEATTWDHMNGQVAVLAEQFEKEHEGITVKIDVLPTEEQERSVYIQQLRTEILRGQGPDVYLLPTSGNLLLDDTTGYIRTSVDPLFSDVVQAMDNGMFRDISALYDEDTELGKEALQTTVMDAGVLEGKRYVLPLRYDIPVIYADVEYLSQLGWDTDVLTQNADQIIAQVLANGDSATNYAFDELGAEVFSQWMDYDGQQVNLDVATIASVMQSYQEMKAQKNAWSAKMQVTNYCHKQYYPGHLVRPRLYVGSLSELLEFAPVYQYEQEELLILPMRSVGGDVVAQVTYYGAVGSGAADPELAYEFLRMFLLEESQWEANRPQSLGAVGDRGRKQPTTNATQVPGLIEKGWPVRTEGSANPLWIVRKHQFYNHKMGYADDVIRERMKKIGRSQLDSVWEQIFQTEPDQVRFGNSMDDLFRELLSQLNDPGTYAPTDVDINALAEAYWWQLRWHVAEG